MTGEISVCMHFLRQSGGEMMSLRRAANVLFKRDTTSLLR